MPISSSSRCQPRFRAQVTASSKPERDVMYETVVAGTDRHIRARQRRDWMAFKPVSVSENADALEALDQTVEQGAALPFDVTWNRRIDPADRGAASGVLVHEAMPLAPITVHPETTLEHAAELSEHRGGCLPVVDTRHRSRDPRGRPGRAPPRGARAAPTLGSAGEHGRCGSSPSCWCGAG